MDKVHKVTWNEYGETLKSLAEKIKKSKEKFDCVIGIPRGGLPVAVHLSHQLKVPYKNYETQISNFGILSNNIPKSEHILLVDDISDTGKSLKEFSSWLAYRLKVVVTIATLHIKEGTETLPDFYIKKFPRDVWIKYPYEREER